MIVSPMGFFLSSLREVTNALQVADNAGHIVHILAVTDGTLVQIPLVNVSTVVANGIRHVKGEVIASLCCCHAE